MVLRPFGPGVDAHQSAVAVVRPARADAFGDDAAGGVLADMDHLGARIGLLAVVGRGDQIELADWIIAPQDRRTGTSR